MGRIDDKMCDDITCEYLHLASVAVMDDIPFDDLTYDDLNLECVSYQTEKLDGVLINLSWLDKLPTAFAEFLPPGISDHSQIGRAHV